MSFDLLQLLEEQLKATATHWARAEPGSVLERRLEAQLLWIDRDIFNIKKEHGE